MTVWCERAQVELDHIRASGRMRATTAFDGDGLVGTVGGRQVISFASNDYLGLTAHPRVREAGIAAIERWGSGAGASRLITGTRSLHQELESALAKWKGTERAIVFPTGFAANLGALQVLGAADTTIFSDELNHASIIDGCRLAKARTLVYRHNDLEHLRQMLEAVRGPRIIVTEAVFSMDGDAAALAELASLCRQHGALLVVDEAHAVLSPALPDGHNDFDYLRVGTLSKTLGAIGGWVAGRAPLIDLLVNRARPFIYTTAPTPADTAAALAALRIYCSEEGARLRSRLRQLVEMIRPGHASPIVPFIIGTETAALAAARQLLERGIYVPAIRPPTVPAGTARLRITLSAAHSDAMVGQLRESLLQLG